MEKELKIFHCPLGPFFLFSIFFFLLFWLLFTRVHALFLHDHIRAQRKEEMCTVPVFWTILFFLHKPKFVLVCFNWALTPASRFFFLEGNASFFFESSQF